jgi:membrane protease YdiL (CAAX protease family)
LFQNTVAKGWNQHLTNIFGTYGITWFYVVIAITLLKALFSALAVSTAVSASMAAPPILSVLPGLLSEYVPGFASTLQASLGLQLFLAVLMAPIFEEIIFRLLPLTLVKRSHPEVILAVQLGVCGVIFGWVHGSPINILIQGVGGFMLGRLYMKNNSSMLAAWGSTALVHAMYNLTVILAWGA